MSDKQKTIQKEVTLEGVGLHTGVKVTMTFKPAPIDFGYKFQRIDLDKQPVIAALAENVVDTARGTTIAKGDARVSTIEHVLAAVYSLGIDNLLIEINGPETPILDGSSIHFFNVLNEAGILDQEADREYFVVRENVRYVNEKGTEIIAYPDNKYSIDVLIDFNSKVLGYQFASIDSLSDFEKEIAPCRTFAFFSELEPLFKNNLIKGGALENAIVIVENEYPQEEFDRIADLFNKPRLEAKRGILNNIKLQFSNEPARHKLLDVIGDLALSGRRIKGKIVAKKPGHYANTEFAKQIRNIVKFEQKNGVAPRYNPDEKPIRDINDIMKTLPHRPPFLLVDKIIHLDETSVVGVKSVTMNEPYFVGHFPEEPVMPGVLQIEAMAQVGGLLVLNDVENPKEWSTYFLKIDNVRFKQKVVPGDTLIFKMELIAPIRRGIAHMRGQVFVGTSLVMDAELMAQVVRNKVIEN